MTLIAAPAPSWVQIDLDTTAPVLLLDAPALVEPPDDWIVLVKANEDLGPVAATFTDAYGTEVRIGVDRVGPRLLAVVLPTPGLATGPGELTVVARDRACNAATVRTTVVVQRPRPFDVVLTLGPTLETTMSGDGAFEVALSVRGALTSQPSLDHAFEVETTIEPALDAHLEID